MQKINDSTFRQYNPNKDFKKIKRNWCDDQESIVGKETLMSKDMDFMNKEKIESECNCVRKDICKAVCDLLMNGKIQEATDLLLQK